jgi:hypothetical protein
MATVVKDYPPVSKYPFVAGPYTPPKASKGDKLRDLMLGDVEVEGMTDGLISWPGVTYRKQLIPVLAGDLVRAVCEEDELAVAHYWGISRYIVGRWRAAIAGHTGAALVHTALAIKRRDPKFRRKWGYRG